VLYKNGQLEKVEPDSLLRHLRIEDGNLSVLADGADEVAGASESVARTTTRIKIL